MTKLKPSDYESCPHCCQRFSFRTPVVKDGVAFCCWCDKELPYTQVESPLDEDDKKRLKTCIDKMRRASDGFYGSAVQAGNHAFIEFCGVMNEYINICEDNLKQGIDFTMCNQHTDLKMQVDRHRFDYLKEKLHCIFEGMEPVEKITGEVEAAATGDYVPNSDELNKSLHPQPPF